MTSRRAVRIVASMAIALSAGCSASSDAHESVGGRLVGEPVGSGATVRVAYGVNWAIGRDVQVDKAGAFQLPQSARVAVAYIDTNGNGEFDRFAEPSGTCDKSEHGWKCSIAFRKTTIYRAIMSRGDVKNDKTLVFWEDFAPNGSAVTDSSICMDQRCTFLDKSPFVTASDTPVRVFSICGSEGFAPQDATISRKGETSRVHVAQPPSVQPEIEADRNHGLHVHIRSPFDRLLIWGGDVDPATGDVRKVYWTSESANVRLARSADGADVDVPERLLASCGHRPCDVVLQLLRVWSHSDDKLVTETEYRTVIGHAL